MERGGRQLSVSCAALIVGVLLFSTQSHADINWWSHGSTGDANGSPVEPAFINSIVAPYAALEQETIDFCKTWTAELYVNTATDCQVQTVSTVTDNGSYYEFYFQLTTDDGGFSRFYYRTLTSYTCTPPETPGSIPGTCDQPSQCDGTITGQGFVRPIYSANDQGEICHEASQCKMVVDDITMLSSNAGLVTYSGTADGCTSEPEVPMTAANQEENCVSSGSDTFCTEPDLADQNCGMLNGEYICLDSVPDGDCTFYGNGNMACSTNAGSPPAPDDGVTPGVPATPDSTIESNGDTINNYNNTTVNNSSGATSGSSQGEGPSQQEIELDFSEIIEQEPDSGTYVIPIDAINDQTSQELDDVATDIGDGTGFAVTNNVGDSWTSIFGYTYSCSDINLFIAGQNVTLECAELADLRAVLAWIANVIFFLGVFQLLMRGPE